MEPQSALRQGNLVEVRCVNVVVRYGSAYTLRFDARSIQAASRAESICALAVAFEQRRNRGNRGPRLRLDSWRHVADFYDQARPGAYPRGQPIHPLAKHCAGRAIDCRLTEIIWLVTGDRAISCPRPLPGFSGERATGWRAFTRLESGFRPIRIHRRSWRPTAHTSAWRSPGCFPGNRRRRPRGCGRRSA